MSARTKQRISFFLNLAVIILEIIAFAQCAASYGLSLFQFYTQDSNLLALITSTIFVVFFLRHKQNKEVPSWIGTVKYMSACCLSVTFVVVMTVLAPLMGGVQGYRRMLLGGAMPYHHLLCPILVVLSFLLFDPTPPIGQRDQHLSMIPTLCYAVVMMLLNIARILDGPYPFLRVYDQPFYLSCIWFVAILGAAYLISWLLRIGYQRLRGFQNSQRHE